MHHRAVILLVAVFALATARPASAELLTNGGFEAGDFSGWMQFGNTGATGVANGQFRGSTPYEGNYQAFFGSVGSTGGIYQDVATTAGKSYVVSFAIANLSGSPSHNWSATFGSTTLAFGINDSASTYQLLTYNVTASANVTRLTFTFRHDPSYYLLDAASVRSASAVPEPSSLVLTAIGGVVAGGAAWRRRRRAAC